MLILQIYFILYSLRGGIVFGIFPAFLAVIRVLISKFYRQDPDEMKYEFKKTYQENFKLANLLMIPVIALLTLVVWEYRYNNLVINSEILRVLLALIIVGLMVVFSHLPITILRFDLGYKDYFSQSLLIALSSPFELISIVLSLLLIEFVFNRWIFIPLLFFAPVLAAPFAWFSNHSVEKIIKKHQEGL